MIPLKTWAVRLIASRLLRLVTRRRLLAVAGAGMVAMPIAMTTADSGYVGELVRVIDADTQVYAVSIWPGLTQEIAIRVRGIDTPEMRRPDRTCPDDGVAEKQLAMQATEQVSDWIKIGEAVWLDNVSLGKYAGRAVADVEFQEGSEMVQLAERLIALGYAKRYDGGRRPSWCGHD